MLIISVNFNYEGALTSYFAFVTFFLKRYATDEGIAKVTAEERSLIQSPDNPAESEKSVNEDTELWIILRRKVHYSSIHGRRYPANSQDPPSLLVYTPTSVF